MFGGRKYNVGAQRGNTKLFKAGVWSWYYKADLLLGKQDSAIKSYSLADKLPHGGLQAEVSPPPLPGIGLSQIWAGLTLQVLNDWHHKDRDYP